MKNNKQSKHHPLFLCIAQIVAAALVLTGCGGGKASDGAAAAQAVIQSDGESLGSGGTAFQLTVADLDGNTLHAEIHTDKTTVGEALEELGVIAGEESPTGIYVKTVNGITVDYDKDGAYWAFYVGDDYAVTGVDATEVTDGGSYALKAEAA